MARDTSRRGSRERCSSAGFSLVEVIIALGLLASVLVAVAGMFVVGQRQVASGRNSSEALAVARGILEELQGWGFHQSYALFDDDGCSPAADTTCTVNSIGNTRSAHWQALLDESLVSGQAQVRFESLDGAPLAVTDALRIRVIVSWVERQRNRSVELATVRM